MLGATYQGIYPNNGTAATPGVNLPAALATGALGLNSALASYQAQEIETVTVEYAENVYSCCPNDPFPTLTYEVRTGAKQ